MSINLGLERMERLLKRLGNPERESFRVLHFAGTNGKGSQCLLLHSILTEALAQSAGSSESASGKQQTSVSTSPPQNPIIEPAVGYGYTARTACFTSPHLLEERDSIKIGRSIVDETLYTKARNVVVNAATAATPPATAAAANDVSTELEANDTKMDKDKDMGEEIKATSFELLTCTAFLIFKWLKIEVACIEVGLGGLLDATNVLPPPLVCVLTKIAIDHTEFLGNTYQEIAIQKAGIIKRGVGAVIVAPQGLFPAVRDIFRERAVKECGIEVFKTLDDEDLKKEGELMVKEVTIPSSITNGSSSSSDVEPPFTVQFEFPKGNIIQVSPVMIGRYQLENIATVLEVVKYLSRQPSSLHHIPILPKHVIDGLSKARNPGRLEWINSKEWGGRLCLDGAHNEDGVQALAQHLVGTRKASLSGVSTIGNEGKCCFIFGLSGKKDAGQLLRKLCLPGDQVIPVEFPAPPGMPWIVSQSYRDILKVIPKDCERISENEIEKYNGNLTEALKMVDRKKTPIVVVCGSLYLVAHFIRSFPVI